MSNIQTEQFKELQDFFRGYALKVDPATDDSYVLQYMETPEVQTRVSLHVLGNAASLQARFDNIYDRAYPAIELGELYIIVRNGEQRAKVNAGWSARQAREHLEVAFSNKQMPVEKIIALYRDLGLEAKRFNDEGALSITQNNVTTTVTSETAENALALFAALSINYDSAKIVPTVPGLLVYVEHGQKTTSVPADFSVERAGEYVENAFNRVIVLLDYFVPMGYDLSFAGDNVCITAKDWSTDSTVDCLHKIMAIHEAIDEQLPDCHVRLAPGGPGGVVLHVANADKSQNATIGHYVAPDDAVRQLATLFGPNASADDIAVVLERANAMGQDFIRTEQTTPGHVVWSWQTGNGSAASREMLASDARSALCLLESARELGATIARAMGVDATVAPVNAFLAGRDALLTIAVGDAGYSFAQWPSGCEIRVFLQGALHPHTLESRANRCGIELDRIMQGRVLLRPTWGVPMEFDNEAMARVFINGYENSLNNMRPVVVQD